MISACAGGEAVAEIHRSGSTLALSVAAYVLLSGAHTHLPSLILLDVSRTLDISIFRISLAIGLGNLLKGLLSMTVSGRAMDRYGAHVCARVTLLLAILLVVLLALASTATSFCAVLVLLVASTSFAEQPCFICLNATHFSRLSSVATSVIASAFSVSGGLMPLLLAPALAAGGGRLVLFCIATMMSLLLPLLLLWLRPGPLAVGSGMAIKSSPGSSPASSAAVEPDEVYLCCGRRDQQRPKSMISVTSTPRGQDDAAPVATGTTAAEALRTPTLYVLWVATYLCLTYGRRAHA